MLKGGCSTWQLTYIILALYIYIFFCMCFILIYNIDYISTSETRMSPQGFRSSS